MLGNFIFAKKKKDFLNELNNGNVSEEAIAFIKDSNEICTHGVEYKGVAWDVLKIDVPEGCDTLKDKSGVLLKDSDQNWLFINI